MFKLFIANKNYSSWSLRPWVLMRELAIPFEENLVPFPSAGGGLEFSRIFSDGPGSVPDRWGYDGLGLVGHRRIFGGELSDGLAGGSGCANLVPVRGGRNAFRIREPARHLQYELRRPHPNFSLPTRCSA